MTSTHLEQAETNLLSVLQEGWPAPGSPYYETIRAERFATRLTLMGELPGLLLDMDLVRDRQRRNKAAPAVAKQRNNLHVARQRLFQARLSSSEPPAVELLLGMHTLREVRDEAPHCLQGQREQLQGAMRAGWNIRLVPDIAMHLPLRTYDMILVEDPEHPQAVYWEARDDGEPHETWDTAASNPDALTRATNVYRHLNAIAIESDFTQVFIENIS